MNYRNLILIALAFAIALVISPAMAENTYGQVNLHPEINYAQQGSPGFVIFYERGVSVQDHNIIVTNDIDPSVNETITINPDGNSGLMQFAAGNYTAYLKQGNGDQPETQHFKAGGGVTTGVAFLGAAIPTHADPAPVIETPGIESDIHIIRAEYGALWTTKAAQKYGLTGNGKFVDVTDILQNLVDGGHTSFTFDVANIRDGVSGEVLATLPDDDPVPGVVKNVIVFYSAPHHLVVIPALAMEQDVGGYSYPSYQLPYHPTTTRTTITL